MYVDHVICMDGHMTKIEVYIVYALLLVCSNNIINKQAVLLL